MCVVSYKEKKYTYFVISLKQLEDVNIECYCFI